MSEEPLAVEPLPVEPLALSTIPPQPPVEGDFEAIYATVRQSARGRWFLDEYARRNRNADTNLVLAAIERIETVVRDGREREAYQSVRGDLLEMARTIAVTRAEVAEIKPEARAESKPASERRAPEGSDVFATAERIQDVAWTMRERGFDPRTCEQIETLARSILSASALRDPNDHRTGKLGEVLQYLEQRIDRMLEAWATGAQGVSQPAAAAQEPPPQDEPTHAGNGHDPAASHAAFVENALGDDTLAGDTLAADLPARDDASTRLHEQVADLEATPDAEVAANVPETTHGPDWSAQAAPESAALEIEPLVVVPPPAVEAESDSTRPVELTLDPIAIAPAPGANAAEPAAEVANTNTAPADHAPSPQEAAAPPQPVAAAPITVAASEPAAATPDCVDGAQVLAQQAPNDPLAALRAMSDEERIALFT
jgi:hypothetical protein